MKKLYKLITVALAFVLCFSLFAACGPDEGDDVMFTIKFHSNSEIDVDDLEYYVNEYTAFPIPERPGYTLKGWYTTEECLGRAYWSLTSETEPATEYWAKWTPRDYKVNLKTNKKKDRIQADVILPDSYYADPDKAPEGYIAPKFTVEDTEEIELPDGGSVRVPEYYTFGGWYDSSDCAGEAVSEIPAGTIGNQNLWPKLTPVDYTLTLNARDGSQAEVIPYNYESAAIGLSNKTRDYYTFGGWFPTTGFSGEPVTSIPTGSYGNRTLYAKWNAVEYGISYQLDGGNWPAGVEYPTAYTTVAAVDLLSPVKTGSSFDGWYTTSGLTTAMNTIPAGKNGNITLYAKWTAVSNSITYNLNGGYLVAGYPQGYNAAAVTLPVASGVKRAGYTFGGWHDNAGLTGTAVTSIAAGSSGTKTYWAKWTPATYDVEWVLNGGTKASTAEATAAFINNYTFGGAKTLPVASHVTKAGYEFGGWYTDADLSGDPITGISVSDMGNKTFYAKWSEQVYTLRYSLGNGGRFGNTPTSYSFKSSDTLPLIAEIPTNRYQFIFLGWYTANIGGTKVENTAVAAGTTQNVTLYARWRTDFTIEYRDTDGSALPAGSLPGNAITTYEYRGMNQITTLPVPTKSGYEFGGWVETINPTADTPASQRLGLFRGEERNAEGNIIDGSGTGGDKVLYALWLSPVTTPSTRQMYAAQTNLYGISGPGYSGSALGPNRLQTDFSAAAISDGGNGAAGKYVGWTHGTGTQFVVYEFTLDRAVSNATVVLGFGSEFSMTATLKGNGNPQPGLYENGIDPDNNLAVVVNGRQINWGSLTLSYGQFGHVTITGVTLAAGKNSIGIEVLRNEFPSGQADGGGGPLINYCTLTVNANIGFVPFTY